MGRVRVTVVVLPHTPQDPFLPKPGTPSFLGPLSLTCTWLLAHRFKGSNCQAGRMAAFQ